MKGTGIFNQAIELIVTNGQIVVYGMNKAPGTCDGFMGIPTDYLGTTYYAVAHFPAARSTQIGIVAQEASTEVTVVLPRRSGLGDITIGSTTLKVGVAGSFTLNAYQTAQIQSRGDLSGTKITATKKIGVFSGNVETDVSAVKAGGDQSHLIEMVPPADQWGKTFILKASDRMNGDVIKIITSNANTPVTISTASGTQALTIAYEGADYTFTLAKDTTAYIVAEKPVMVTQFLRSVSTTVTSATVIHKDPAMIVIPPREQWRPLYPFYSPSFPESDFVHHIMVVVKKADKAGLYLDGKQVCSTVKWVSCLPTDFSMCNLTLLRTS